MVGAGTPQPLTTVDISAIAQGVMLCLAHKRDLVRSAALSWCVRRPPPTPPPLSVSGDVCPTQQDLIAGGP